MSNSFGEFLREKRKKNHLTIRALAELIGKSPSFISQLESGTRLAPKGEKLHIIADALSLDKKEYEEYLDLAAISRNIVSEDLTQYINSHSEVKEAIRLSKSHDVPEEEWSKFSKNLKDKFFV